MPPEILTTVVMPPTEPAHLAFGPEAKESLLAGFANLTLETSPEDNQRALGDLQSLGELIGQTLAPHLGCNVDARPFVAVNLIEGLFDLEFGLDQATRNVHYYRTGINHMLKGVMEGALPVAAAYE